MSNDNQYTFEVARDLISMLLELPDGETLQVAIKRHGNLYDWDTNRGCCYSYSEIAQALRWAWENAHKRLKDGRPMKLRTVEEYEAEIERLRVELVAVKKSVRLAEYDLGCAEVEIERMKTERDEA